MYSITSYYVNILKTCIIR